MFLASYFSHKLAIKSPGVTGHKVWEKPENALWFYGQPEMVCEFAPAPDSKV